MNRPSFEEIYMQMAHLVAQRGTCARLKVGCVITSVDHRRVLAIGYNGNAMGLRNSCDFGTPGACGCLHAEENAIISCTAPRALEKTIYITHSPCKMCAKRIVNLGGVTKVYYDFEYRSIEGLVILYAAGINFYHLERP